MNETRETIETCKHTRENLDPQEPCSPCVIQIRFPNGTTTMGGFFPGEKFVEILTFARSFYSEDRQQLVALRLPHLASSSTILSEDLTLEELSLSPRATLIASTRNDDERTQTLQQSRVVVMEEIETKTDHEKLARQRKLAEQEARRKEKEDALRAFQVSSLPYLLDCAQEDRERQKGIQK